MELETHPGYLGLTSDGVVLIHADWPTYGVTHGWEHSLVRLGMFPRKTVFTGIDDVDQCVLFLVGDPRAVKDKWSERHFHVAGWHEDLLELMRLGYVSGNTLTASGWSALRAKELFEFTQTLLGGAAADVPRPSAADFSDAEALHGLAFDDGLVVSDPGWDALERLLFNEKHRIADEILARIRGVMSLGQYDTAIREACVLIESRIRAAIGSQSYGQTLINEYFAKLGATGRVLPAWLKVIRSEFRALFRFVRNDYMHNLRTISETQCYAILCQTSSVYAWTRKFEDVLRSLPSAAQ